MQGRLPMLKPFALVSMLSLMPAFLAGCANPLTTAARTAGTAAGNAAGVAVADTQPPPATQVLPPAPGGHTCPTLKALGWPVFFEQGDALNRTATVTVVSTSDFYAKHCGGVADD